MQLLSLLRAASKPRANPPLMHKTLCFFSVLVLLVVSILPKPVTAIDLGSGLARGAAVKAGYDKNTTDTTFAETIGSVIKALLSFTGVIFLVLTVYAGFLWMNARGDESQIEKSQSILRSAIIGLVITVGAYSITNFIVPRIVSKTAGGDPAAQGPNLNQIAQCRANCQADCNARPVNVGEAFEACIAQCEAGCAQ